MRTVLCPCLANTIWWLHTWDPKGFYSLHPLGTTTKNSLEKHLSLQRWRLRQHRAPVPRRSGKGKQARSPAREWKTSCLHKECLQFGPSLDVPFKYLLSIEMLGGSPSTITAWHITVKKAVTVICKCIMVLQSSIYAKLIFLSCEHTSFSTKTCSMRAVLQHAVILISGLKWSTRSQVQG